MRQETPFFEESLEACRRLGRRGVLISPLRESAPRDLPFTVRHAEYAPFSKLLPRAAALVSHGGIGTVAYGLAAGVPQVAAPMAFDQFDNASRLEDLGVGRSLPMRRYSAHRVAKVLRDLLGSPRVARRCEEIATRVRGEDGVARACEEIEALGSAVDASSRAQ
jgi:UDP:flavonoid glycosyltransferase YjiC (YdhE family)